MSFTGLVRHPVFVAGAVLFALRLMAGIARTVSSSSAPRDWVEPIVVGTGYLAGETFLLTGILLLLWIAAGALRPLASWAIALLLPAVLLAAIADMIVFQVIGDRLTPSVLRQFVGFRLFTDTDFVEPVLGNWPAVGAGVALVACFGAFVIGQMRRLDHAGDDAARMIASAASCCGLSAIALYGAFTVAPMSGERPLLFAFVQEATGRDGVSLKGGRDAAIDDLRRFVGLPAGRKWAGPQMPLVHVADTAAAGSRPAANRPDIVIIMIESLRAPALGYIAGPGHAQTPALDELAARSVVFPGFLSNGFPSGPGFTSTTCSHWPHYRRRVIVDFRHIRFDCLPTRLSSLGYRTAAIEFDPGTDGTRIWLDRLYDQLIDTSGSGVRSDKVIFERARQLVAAHDEAGPTRPLLLYIKTKSPHLPYFTPDDGGGPPEGATGKTLPMNYRHNLAYVDRQVGGFVRFLDARPRADDTVVVVLGDHANFLDQQSATGLPVNDAVWTSMLFHGPTRYVGPPRTVRRPASQVDLMPTLMAILGDHRPTGSVGRDLFGPPRAGEFAEFALAVRSGGVRMDRDGYSLLQPSNNPARSTIDRFSVLDAGGDAGHAFARQDRERLFDRILAWSYLIEKDMVWDPRLLDSELVTAPASAAVHN